MAQGNGAHPGHAGLFANGSGQEGEAHAQTWDAMDSYFECITTCSLDDGDCVTQCVEQLREHG